MKRAKKAVVESQVEQAPQSASATPANASGLAGPVKDGEDTYFARSDLHKLEVAQLKTKSAKQAAELRQAQLDAFIAAQEIARLETERKVAAVKDEVSKLAMEYHRQADLTMRLYKDIGDVYDLDMERMTYDPITGRINRLPSK